MHRLPQLFSHGKKPKPIDPKHKGTMKPQLKRTKAAKNIDYEPSTSSSSPHSDQSSQALRTRSLDLSPLADRTSFRVEGKDGEFELICRILGLSGPEDFSIPVAAWEAMKVRSSSDVLPRYSGLQFDSPKVELQAPEVENGGISENSVRFSDSVRVCNATEQQIEPAELNNFCSTYVGGGAAAGGGHGEICELSNKFERSVRVSGLSVNKNEVVESVGCGVRVENSGGGGRGIKGVRPPVLAPPPAMTLSPVIDNAGSTWDILRSFAPDADRNFGFGSRGGFSSDDEQEEGDEGSGKREEEEGNNVRLGGRGVLSESCSFTTTSNDDDSSSTTTEPMSNSISPNGRFRRIITYWEKGELLGCGSFGTVYEGIADNGFFFAVKEVSLLDQGDQGRQSIIQLEQEIALLSQFEHENIVRYYGTDKDESKLYIFLELITKGSLLSLYQKYNLRDSQVSAYTRQILHGLKYLHDRNVVHRDIKCANILVDASGLVKLADFGLAKATTLNDVKSCKGTAFWMAPEVVNRKKQGYGLAADIWSLGCTVLEMLTRQLPYYPLECMPALFRIGRSIPPPVPESLSRDARDFILQCLQVNPNARPTAAQLLDHPFVKRSLFSSSGSASPHNPGRRV